MDNYTRLTVRHAYISCSILSLSDGSLLPLVAVVVTGEVWALLWCPSEGAENFTLLTGGEPLLAPLIIVIGESE